MKSLLLLLHPGFLAGFRLGDLLCFLHRNSWRVDTVLWPRALVAICGATATSALSRFEPKHAASCAEAPIFILGLARSGTTFLHQLLATHPQLTSPTRLECYNPHTFLLLHRLGVASALYRRPLHTRYIDGVLVGWSEPDEDEYGIFLMTDTDGVRSQILPRSDPGLSCGLSTRRDDADSDRWTDGLRYFCNKVSYAHGKRLVLKSPSHTFRIPDILRVFPKAKFLTVVRDPVAHFQSFRAAFGRSRAAHDGWGALQTHAEVPDQVLLDQISAQIRKYVADRSLIPRGNLIELRYEDLVADPVRTVAAIVSDLGLPRWPDIERVCLERTLGAPAYTRNRYERLPDGLEAMVTDVYAPITSLVATSQPARPGSLTP